MLRCAWPLRAILSLILLISFYHCIAYKSLSDETLRSLPEPGSDFDIHDGVLLAPILQPRVPGTPGSEAVRKHITDFFKVHLPKWNVELQSSSSKTPTSGDEEVPFVNIIATRDPPRSKPGEVGRLALVAHYDSKMEPEGFIGATDSAAPCAMLLHVARSLDEALTRMWEEKSGADADRYGALDEDKGVQVLFLDGEEAFERWSARDSLYGARALAESWEQTLHPAMSTYHNQLSSISLFLLLDLLGAKNPRVPSYFRTTHWAYQQMGELEKRLRSLQQFKSSPNHPSKRSQTASKNSGKRAADEPQFLKDTDNDKKRFMSGIEDDHVPFMARGVEVLHLIPSPFPKVWHKMTDDGEHLDIDTVADWAKLVTAFAAEWLDLNDHFNAASALAAEDAAAAARARKERDELEGEEDGKAKQGNKKRSITSKTEL